MHIFYLVLFLSLNLFAQNRIDPVKLGVQSIEVDRSHVLALTFKNDKKWHTYWKNPGDAGTEIKVEFFQGSKKLELKEYPWPMPKRYIEQGDLWAYGYSGTYPIFFELSPKLAGTNLTIKAQWLVCKDICIPGSKVIDVIIPDNFKVSQNSFLSKGQLEKEFKKLPEPGEARFELFLNKGTTENTLSLNYLIENADFAEIDDKTSVLYPYLQFPFDFKHENLHIDEENKIIYGRMYIDWDGIYEEPIWNLPEDGVFKKPITVKFLTTYPLSERPRIITKTFKQFSLVGDKGLSETFAKLKNKSAAPSQLNQRSLLLILLFGFLGGLILNLMPCVLPVISLKLFGLIAHRDESKSAILKHNFAYTAGVVSSFLLLAAVIVSIKATGVSVGWGFQLQSPLFVFGMLMLIFIMTLNMLGLFEFVTPGGRVLGNKQLKKGFAGDFFNGVLATILSTPCSAPFLGTALTFAFTTTYINVFIVFTSIGLGLAFPFILTGFFPRLISFLPKPGGWMEKLKNILGLTLLLTTLWLYDILGGLIDMDYSGIYINSILAFTFFGFFLRKNITKSPWWSFFIFALPLLIFAQTLKQKGFESKQETGQVRHTSQNWQKWSPEKLAQTQGPIFINFTAKWCLTCKVNKKLVLETDAFSEIVSSKNITLLEGDWTKRDQEITDFLRSHGIVGVPAYFVKDSYGKIHSLGETISIGKIREYIK